MSWWENRCLEDSVDWVQPAKNQYGHFTTGGEKADAQALIKAHLKVSDDSDLQLGDAVDILESFISRATN